MLSALSIGAGPTDQRNGHRCFRLCLVRSGSSREKEYEQGTALQLILVAAARCAEVASDAICVLLHGY